ncbi:hypothetical protein D1J36_004115 [Riemerella anatipestifer]|uniref:hypothetical protein n=1 Tax=Riemerella anatipestifer TaxID=34085 RepID=UPI0012ADAC15|nr:hypothetical protein [Riemerella anatipestifer]USL96295.1 hypothetical protein D1J36_004115 [Riemerella anatipestifer]
MNIEGFLTFFKGDKEYKSPSTSEIIETLDRMGINTDHHCLIRKQVSVIVNDASNLNLDENESDSEFEKTLKKEIKEGKRSITLVV